MLKTQRVLYFFVYCCKRSLKENKYAIVSDVESLSLAAEITVDRNDD